MVSVGECALPAAEKFLKDAEPKAGTALQSRIINGSAYLLYKIIPENFKVFPYPSLLPFFAELFRIYY
jgi:hypothetical protein